MTIKHTIVQVLFYCSDTVFSILSDADALTQSKCQYLNYQKNCKILHDPQLCFKLYIKNVTQMNTLWL